MHLPGSSTVPDLAYVPRGGLELRTQDEVGMTHVGAFTVAHDCQIKRTVLTEYIAVALAQLGLLRLGSHWRVVPLGPGEVVTTFPRAWALLMVSPTVGGAVQDEEEFSAFVRSRSDDLQRMAWLLTGDWSMAQDLVQASLVKTWQRWRAIRRRDAPEVYVRRVLMTTFLGWRRRRWTSEVALGWLPENAGFGDVAADAAQHEVIAAALRRLPKQQRAVIVLRFLADLSEQDAADAMGCSVGTVKSHTSRALATLRANGALRDAMAEESR
jgi:RNA polymerase sigma-70 factor (sigma-E family)